MKKILCILLALALAVAFVACSEAGSKKSSELWETALYTEDTTLGSGEKTICVDVVADKKTVTFTLKTDADNLGAALTEAGLIKGDMGEFGIYINEANGITASWDKDKAYWALTKNKELLMTSADATKIASGEHYELVYTK